MGTAHVLMRWGPGRCARRGGGDHRQGSIATANGPTLPRRRPLGGHDPYSASKGGGRDHHRQLPRCLLAAQGVAVATARAGNVMAGRLGGRPPAARRRAPGAPGSSSPSATLRATRPWQHVIEPLAAYLCLAERLWADPARAGAHNFGPLPHEAATVGYVVKMASSAYPESATSYENQ